MTAAAAIDHQTAPASLEIFRERAEAKVLLIQNGYLDLQDSVDALQEAAVKQGLVREHGQDEVQRVLAEAFAKVDKPGRKIIVSTLARPFTKLTELERLAILRQCHDLEQCTSAPIDEPRRDNLRRYHTTRSTIDAFKYVVGLGDREHLARWLADHPYDAPELRKIWRGPPCPQH